MDTLELDRKLNQMIIERRSADAFLQFYAEDVVTQENDEPERRGREEWMRARLELENNITKFDARVLSHAANGNTSFSEWEYQVEIQGMGEIRIAQVAVRHWQNGRVVRERFYHK
jgi:ketosteroid isomerase-like protein